MTGYDRIDRYRRRLRRRATIRKWAGRAIYTTGYIILTAAAVALLLALANMASAEADKVTICHATGSESNPYVEITIARASWETGHSPHASHDGDFLVTAGLVCPPMPATPTPSVTPVASSVDSEPNTNPNMDAETPPAKALVPTIPLAFPDSGGAPRGG